jgi:hypothetical protein
VGWPLKFQCLGVSEVRGEVSSCAQPMINSICSRFNVLNTPISTTASIDAKPHVWPIDGIAQWLTNQQSLLGHIQAKTDVFWLAAGYQGYSVNHYKCIIDTHIILVRVVRIIPNSCIKYSTQNQCSLTLTILIIIWISIILLFQFNSIHLFDNYSCVRCQRWPPMEFSCAEYSADHSALFQRNIWNLCYL